MRCTHLASDFSPHRRHSHVVEIHKSRRTAESPSTSFEQSCPWFDGALVEPVASITI